MATLNELEEIIGKLSPAEKAQVLQWVIRDLGNTFPNIEHNPAIAGGVACIAQTRIPVWTLVQFRRLGLTDSQILEAYPGLDTEDLDSAWAYAWFHQSEIDAQIRENETA
jgi:uncharacterized protein (DUF433 family)